MSHLSRKCPKNGTTGQKSETKWDKKCPVLIENVQGGQVGHRLNIKKCPSGTKMSRLNIKGQMSRLRQNICYASLLACGERSARALRANDCYFWIRMVKFGSFGGEVYQNSPFWRIKQSSLAERSGLPSPSTVLQFPDHGPSRPQPRRSNFSLSLKKILYLRAKIWYLQSYFWPLHETFSAKRPTI